MGIVSATRGEGWLQGRFGEREKAALEDSRHQPLLSYLGSCLASQVRLPGLPSSQHWPPSVRDPGDKPEPL